MTGSRAEARLRHGAFVRGASSGMFGGPVQHNFDALVDTLDAAGVDLGRFDREVIGQLAVLLDPVACAVLVSLFERTADAPPGSRLPAVLPAAGEVHPCVVKPQQPRPGGIALAAGPREAPFEFGGHLGLAVRVQRAHVDFAGPFAPPYRLGQVEQECRRLVLLAVGFAPGSREAP